MESFAARSRSLLSSGAPGASRASSSAVARSLVHGRPAAHDLHSGQARGSNLSRRASALPSHGGVVCVALEGSAGADLRERDRSGRPGVRGRIFHRACAAELSRARDRARGFFPAGSHACRGARHPANPRFRAPGTRACSSISTSSIFRTSPMPTPDGNRASRPRWCCRSAIWSNSRKKPGRWFRSRFGELIQKNESRYYLFLRD